MNTKHTVGWIARVLAMLFALQLALGWWDEMQARTEPGNSNLPAIIAFDRYAILTHLLPLVILIAGIIIGWKRPLWGAIAFGIYAVLGVLMVFPEWLYLPVISGPPLIVAALYFWSRPSQAPQKS